MLKPAASSPSGVAAIDQDAPVAVRSADACRPANSAAAASFPGALRSSVSASSAWAHGLSWSFIVVSSASRSASAASFSASAYSRKASRSHW